MLPFCPTHVSVIYRFAIQCMSVGIRTRTSFGSNSAFSRFQDDQNVLHDYYLIMLAHLTWAQFYRAYKHKQIAKHEIFSLIKNSGLSTKNVHMIFRITTIIIIIIIIIIWKSYIVNVSTKQGTQGAE